MTCRNADLATLWKRLAAAPTSAGSDKGAANEGVENARAPKAWNISRQPVPEDLPDGLSDEQSQFMMRVMSYLNEQAEFEAATGALVSEMHGSSERRNKARTAAGTLRYPRLMLAALGAAGSGKSFAVREIVRVACKHLRLTATTGVAVTNLALPGATTLHSLMRWNERRHTTSNGKSHAVATIAAQKRKAINDAIGTAKILIIDEVSMLSAEHLEQLNTELQQARECARPFGGLGVILSGTMRSCIRVSIARARSSAHALNHQKLPTLTLSLAQVTCTSCRPLAARR